MQPPSDETLMRRIAGGDHAAFAALSARHLPRVTGLAQRILGDRSEAEDVAQETLLRLWAKAPGWRPPEEGGAALSTWLWRVACNLAIDRRRRPAAAPLEDAPEPADERPDPGEQLARREVAARVRAAVAALPERQRAALSLCQLEGRSNAEAADLLGLTVGAVESLLVRARRELRRSLADLRAEDMA